MIDVLVDVGYACYVIECENKIVKNAPPIAKWMIGKDTETVKNWIRKKNGTYALVTQLVE